MAWAVVRGAAGAAVECTGAERPADAAFADVAGRDGASPDPPRAAAIAMPATTSPGTIRSIRSEHALWKLSAYSAV